MTRTSTMAWTSAILAAATLAACSNTATMTGSPAASFVAPPRPATRVRMASLPANPLAWPKLSTTNKPFTRWWWLGSAVTQEEISRQLGMLDEAGEGGVEICPIYGVQGNEANDIPFLSPKWIDMFAATTTTAKQLGMVVDMTTGTGWPFGGGPTTPADASSAVNLQRYTVAAGGHLTDKLPKGTLQYACAISPAGVQTDITASARDGAFDWTAPAAPAGQWRVYAVGQSDGIQKVKRAAPGGEGLVLDPYSTTAMTDYLHHFDEAFAAAHFDAPNPRAQFHDSFEYYGADWTDDFFAQFQKRRGYDLRTQLPALMGEEGVPADDVARVKCDYRETLADLHLAYMKTWTDWAHSHGELSRNQAHGSPANILDAYAVSDIPECEIFHLYEEGQLPFLKLANSAAHVTGKALASSESFTWLGDHFSVSLNDVKPAADFLFIAGVNHIFFHGTPYSPASAAWPGYNFYASVNFGPNGGIFHDLPAMNAYIARCQSILQANKPGNDVLLYMPFYEVWQQKEGMMVQFTTPGDWMRTYPFYATAMEMYKKGYAYDEVSDALLQDAAGSAAGIALGGNTYKAIVVPETPILPVETMRKLVALAKGGAHVVFLGKTPADVPGMKDVDQRRKELAALAAELPGNVTTGAAADVDALLTGVGARRETMMDEGIRFTRRFRSNGVDYFLVNRSDKAVDGWVPLATGVSSAVLMNPLHPEETGLAAIRHSKDDARVYLQLAAGESCILRTMGGETLHAPDWKYVEPGAPVAVRGTWHVHFLEKVDPSETLPADFSTSTLGSYTDRGPDYKVFAGTAVYTTTFNIPAAGASDYRLDLGDVGDSARVTLNGHDLGTLWCAPFRVRTGGALHAGENTLRVEVTNVAANRIADLDRRGVKWKIFKDTNMVNIKAGTRGDYVPMDASTYPEHASGLMGPVVVVPLAQKNVGG